MGAPGPGVQRVALGHRAALRLAEARRGYCLEQGMVAVQWAQLMSCQ